MVDFNTQKTEYMVYFAIKGEFDPDKITSLLNMKPSKKWKAKDMRKDGKTYYGFSIWQYGNQYEKGYHIEDSCLKLIRQLHNKEDVLIQIGNDYDVSFVLEIVPNYYVNDTLPSLSFSKEIIDFCSKTNTYIDIDVYVYDE